MKTLREMMDLIESAQRTYGGGDDNAGGHWYYKTGDDGTTQSVYVPGPQSNQSYSSKIEPEPDHPLKGRLVTDGRITGRLIRTEQQGKTAIIKDADGKIHGVDADTVKPAGKKSLEETDADPIQKIEELFRDKR